jgi:hypothetical protein
VVDDLLPDCPDRYRACGGVPAVPHDTRTDGVQGHLLHPYTLATIVVATIWENIYSPVYGITAVLGLDLNVLGGTSTALPGVAIANTWQWWGYLMIVFIAAMASVNPSLYEAAKLDGANGFQQFLNITLPGIRPHPRVHGPHDGDLVVPGVRLHLHHDRRRAGGVRPRW